MRFVKTQKLRRYFSANRKLLPSFFRYVCIGGVVFFIDLGMFQLLLLSRVYRPLATTIAYTLAVGSHFTLNKFLNFRNCERSTARQLRTYLVVVVLCWMVTLLVIETGVRGLGLTPLSAKLAAVAINIPTGFLGHRYLTFGSGIRATLRRLSTIIRL